MFGEIALSNCHGQFLIVIIAGEDVIIQHQPGQVGVEFSECCIIIEKVTGNCRINSYLIGDIQCNNQLIHREYVSLAVLMFQRIEEAVTSTLGMSNDKEYKVFFEFVADGDALGGQF